MTPPVIFEVTFGSGAPVIRPRLNPPGTCVSVTSGPDGSFRVQVDVLDGDEQANRAAKQNAQDVLHALDELNAAAKDAAAAARRITGGAS